MNVIRKIEDVFYEEQKTGVALGTFDGLHIGHQKVVSSLVKTCKEKNLKSIVYTFSNHPREFTNKDSLPNRILTLEEKIDFFETLGIDELVLVEFDDFQKNITAHDFIVDLLLEKLNMTHLVIGFNFRFGKGAEGDVSMLNQYAQKYKFKLSVIEGVYIEEDIVSSTRIREQLRLGHVENCKKLLGRNYTASGMVIKGKQVGAQLGFPTANILVSPNMTLLKSGVYITKTHIGIKTYKSVTNVGFNPTFNQNNFNLETYIFDFSENIYHKFITVEFIHRLRDEMKYSSLDGLKEQINKDVQEAKAYFKKKS